MHRQSFPKVFPTQMHLDDHISYLDRPRSAPIARMLGLFSYHPILQVHGRTPILKGRIGIHGGDEEGQRMTASASRDRSAQDQEEEKAALDRGNSGRQRAAAGGREMASAADGVI
jgi:hypothetical protein